MDEPTRHDASCVTEILARGIERVQQICERKGRVVPTKTDCLWGQHGPGIKESNQPDVHGCIDLEEKNATWCIGLHTIVV